MKKLAFTGAVLLSTSIGFANNNQNPEKKQLKTLKEL